MKTPDQADLNPGDILYTVDCYEWFDAGEVPDTLDEVLTKKMVVRCYEDGELGAVDSDGGRRGEHDSIVCNAYRCVGSPTVAGAIQDEMEHCESQVRLYNNELAWLRDQLKIVIKNEKEPA